MFCTRQHYYTRCNTHIHWSVRYQREPESHAFIMVTRKVRDKFPIWLHPTGQRAKKHHNSHFYYFGIDRDEVLKRFAAEWDKIKGGCENRPKKDKAATNRKDLVNIFLTAKG
jgi:hypothetical protein